MSQPQPETRIASNVAEKAKAGLIKHLESSVANSDQNTREDLSATPRVDSIAFLAGSTVIGQWVVNKRRAQEIERENNQLRAELEPRNGHTFESLQKMWEDAHIEISQLISKLSDEQAARTEITRKYHEECAKLAQELEEAKDQVNHYRAHYESTLANCNDVISRAESSEAKLAQAEKDKARLDWLDTDFNLRDLWNKGSNAHGGESINLRVFIDAAMKQTT